jgi:pimeloyl-ACP methyl ester carboxylesterase
VLKVVSTDRRRTLAVETWGSPDGTPVFLLHGTPGSRNGPRPRGIVLYRLGVRLISYDRPGYGGSDRQPGRTVRHAAEDIKAIADQLGLGRFSIVGRSGGGPHALAAAALLKERVKKVAALVSLAPPDADGLNWYDGMASYNAGEFQEAESSLAAVRARLMEQAGRIREDPEQLLEAIDDGLTHTDRRVVEDVIMRRLLTETYAEGVRQNAGGWIDDTLALRRSWGFDLSDIERPTLLWHGDGDKFSPVRHTQWLAKKIPNALPWIERGTAHFGAMEILPRVLSWITAPAGVNSPFKPVPLTRC